MATARMKPIYLYAPITRVDEEERIVEGYCFVNETVPGEGGIRLKRSAMEAATAGYLEFGAVRSMHQPLAAGTALSLDWDEVGAKLRAKIVDDQEWRKVKERVYKGFSLGVAPKLRRGNDIEVVEWIENSLVDRPKDPGAVFTMARAAGAGPEAEYEVELLPAEDAELETLERATGSPGVREAPEAELGEAPPMPDDFRIEEEPTGFCLYGPDGQKLGEFPTREQAEARGREVADVMKDGDGMGHPLDATDQHAKASVSPSDAGEKRVDAAVLAPGEQCDLRKDAERAMWQVYRAGGEELLFEAEGLEAVGAWLRAQQERCGCEGPPSDPGLSVPIGDGIFSGSFAAAIGAIEPQRKAALAWETLRNTLEMIAYEAAADREARARQAIAEFADYVAPVIGAAGEERAALLAEFTRSETSATVPSRENLEGKAAGTTPGRRGKGKPGSDPDNDNDGDGKDDNTPPAGIDANGNGNSDEEDEYDADGVLKKKGEKRQSDMDKSRAALGAVGASQADARGRRGEGLPAEVVTRLTSLETENGDLAARITRADRDLAEVRLALGEHTRLLASAEAEVKRLLAMPAPTPPVLFPKAFTAEHFSQLRGRDTERRREIVTRMTEILALPKTMDQESQNARATELMVLKAELRGLGD